VLSEQVFLSIRLSYTAMSWNFEQVNELEYTDFDSLTVLQQGAYEALGYD